MNEKSIAAIQNGTHLYYQQKRALTVFGQPTKKCLRRLVSAAIVLTLAGVFVAPMAFARVT